jgi:hypothetical protein
LLHSDLSRKVVEALVNGVEKFIYTSPSVVVKRRHALLKLLLCDSDGLMEARRHQAHDLLETKVCGSCSCFFFFWTFLQGPLYF